MVHPNFAFVKEDVNVIVLENENESIMRKLENIENKICELDAKIVESEQIISKLIAVEQKC